nr:immunoglobulin light chain junction region [Macaca mulatta]MOW03897.1 immunoglobulin light chain junction region [Macaca mulatta]
DYHCCSYADSYILVF